MLASRVYRACDDTDLSMETSFRFFSEMSIAIALFKRLVIDNFITNFKLEFAVYDIESFSICLVLTAGQSSYILFLISLFIVALGFSFQQCFEIASRKQKARKSLTHGHFEI